MAVFKGIVEYRKELDRKIKDMKKAGDFSARKTAEYMVLQARKLAPRHTGQTIRGIRWRKRTSSGRYVVESWVPGAFKQNLWANRTAPYRTIHARWNKGKSTVYGDGSHRTTGTPRFFHLAGLRAREKMLKLVTTNTRKALQTRI